MPWLHEECQSLHDTGTAHDTIENVKNPKTDGYQRFQHAKSKFKKRTYIMKIMQFQKADMARQERTRK